MHAKLLLAAVLLSLSCFAAQAQQATPAAGATPQSDAQDPPGAKAEVSCLRYTGSLVIAAQNRRNERRAAGSDAGKAGRPVCNGSAGQSYTRADIQNTGAIGLADALRKLDPAIH